MFVDKHQRLRLPLSPTPTPSARTPTPSAPDPVRTHPDPGLQRRERHREGQIRGIAVRFEHLYRQTDRQAC
jgi:hypothetical protein